MAITKIPDKAQVLNVVLVFVNNTVSPVQDESLYMNVGIGTPPNSAFVVVKLRVKPVELDVLLETSMAYVEPAPTVRQG